MRDDAKALARVWLKLIEEDLGAARLLLPSMRSPAAFHVQQAVEKSLKAAIVLSEAEPAKIHDLKRLYIAAKPVLRWSADEQWLGEVTSWAITTRYGAMDHLPAPSLDAVQEALIAAEALVAEIRSLVR